MASPAILTFLIADIRGYTSFTAERGDEAAATLAATFAEIAREAVEAYSGEVVELRGDEALAVFNSPRQALRAAVGLQQVLSDEVALHPTLPLNVGIGVDAGEAVPVEKGYRGAALNVAARLCSRATSGQVLASESVVHLAGKVNGLRFDDGGEATLKGLDAPARIKIVSAADSVATANQLTPNAGPTELPPQLDVGTPLATIRAADARRLRWWWRQTRGGTGGLALISGAAGMGKTRLAAEPAALAAADGASVVYVSAQVDIGPALERATSPTLIVVDDLGDGAEGLLTKMVPATADRPVLLVVCVTDATSAALSRAAGDRLIQLGPLDRSAVAEIIALYAPDAEAPPIDAILQASAGIPARIHRLTSQWAESEATRKLAAAATRASEGRSGLRALETDLADNVVDLQFARERALLYGTAEGAKLFDGTRESPFKGLAPFEADDADVFFGRERLVAEMIGRLAGATLLGVVGPSGSGKSSAVRAGLMPALASGILPESDSWLRVVMRPGAHPLRALDRALWAALPDRERPKLEASDTPLRAVLDGRKAGERLVLLIDQFEELFTETADEEERAAFVAAIVDAANDPQSRALVIGAIRADFYGHCAAYPALAELLGASHILVGPMTADEYRRAIVQPAVRSGLRVEPGLADALVADVLGEPGALPLLSASLLELWQRRRGRTLTVEAHEQAGGVRGAVARLAEQAYESLDAEERDLVRGVMLRLAGQGEGDAVVRRRVPLAEFDTSRNPRVAHILAVLTDARLVTTSEGTVEVAHEALLREWPRFKEWLEEDREGQRLRTHLIVAAKEWDGAGRDTGELYRGARLSAALDWTADHNLELNELERSFLGNSREASEREADRQRRSNRLLRALLAGAAVLLLIAVAAGGFAFLQSQRAIEAATNAEASRLGAQAVVEGRLDTSLLLAREAFAINDSIDTRGTLLASLLKGPAAAKVLPGTGNRMLYIVGSTDGGTLLIGDNVGRVAIYNGQQETLERIVDFDGQAWLSLTPDGHMAVGSNSNRVRNLVFLDPRDGSVRLQPLADGEDFVGAGIPAVEPGGQSFVMMETRQGQDGIVLVRRDLTGLELRVDPLPLTDVEFIGFTDDGRHLLVSSTVEPNNMTVLDAQTLAVQRTIATKGFAWDMAPDNRTLAVGRLDGTVALYDIETGAETLLEGRHTARIHGIGFSPDGSVLVSTGDDSDVIVWDVAARAETEVLHGHAGRIHGTVFDADGSTAFTVGLDGRVIAWDLAGNRRIGRRLPFETKSTDQEAVAAVSPDGSLFAINRGGSEVEVVNAVSGAIAWQADPWSDDQIKAALAADPTLTDFDTDVVSALSFSPDGQTLAVGGQNVEAVTYEATSGRELRRWHASRMGWVNNLSFAADGSLLTANDDGRVVTWDAASGTMLRELRVRVEATDTDSYSGAPMFVRQSPDGSRVAVVYYEPGKPYRVANFNVETGTQLFDVEADRYGTIVAWSPDGSRIVMGGRQSGAVALLDSTTGGQPLEPALASSGFVLSLDYAWDGRLVVTAGTDSTIRLFDAATLKQVGANLSTGGNGWTFGFVRGADELLGLVPEGQIWHWDLDPQRWAEQACSVANRQLSEAEWRAFLPDRPYAPSCGR